MACLTFYKKETLHNKTIKIFLLNFEIVNSNTVQNKNYD